MPTRTTLIAVAVASLVGTALWLRSSAPSATSDRVPLPAPRDVQGELSTFSDPLATEAREALDVAIPTADSEDEKADNAFGDSILFSGRLVLATASGDEPLDDDGSARFMLSLSDSARLLEVDVTDGRFSVELAPTESGYTQVGADERPYPAQVAGARLSPQPPELTEHASNLMAVTGQRFQFGMTDVVVRLREVPALVLHVVDESSGAELTDVRVIHSWDGEEKNSLHPGAAAETASELASGPSPLVLRPDARLARQSLDVFVHSPGFTWQALQLNTREGGERRVTLSRGGSLSVLFDRRLDSGVLRLRAEDGTPDFGTPALEPPVHEVDVKGCESLEIDDLLPGRYALTVEIGTWWDPLVLGSAGSVVVAGAHRTVQMSVDEAPESDAAPLAGTLIVPEAWGEPSALTIEYPGTALIGGGGWRFLHPDDMEQRAPGVYAWDAGLVELGHYKLSYGQFAHSMVVEVGPLGLEDVVLEVPPPVEVTIVVRDAHTRELAEVGPLRWHCARPAGVTSGFSDQVHADSDSGLYHLQAPDGAEVELRFWTVKERFIARDGLQLEFEVEPSAVVILRLKDGDTPVPWPSDDFGIGWPVDGQGRLRRASHEEGGLRYQFTQTGRYQIDIPSVPGFEPHDPLEMDALAGETLELDVALIRKR